MKVSRKNMTQRLSRFAIGAIFVASPLAKANLITNGSFENGPFQSNVATECNSPSPFFSCFDSLTPGSTDIDAWKITRSEADLLEDGAFDLGASEGSWFVDLTGLQQNQNTLAGVEQSVDLTVGSTYRLMFDVGLSPNRFGNEPGNVYGIDIYTSGNDTIETVLSPVPNAVGQPGNDFWTTKSVEFVAQQQTSTIEIVGNLLDVDNRTAYIGLDNVSLTLLSDSDGNDVAEAPAPVPLVLIGLGLAGLGWKRGKKSLTLDCA